MAIEQRFEHYGQGGLEGEGLLESWTEEREETEEEQADREFREAVSNASSVADLKDALLGTNSRGRADSRPS